MVKNPPASQCSTCRFNHWVGKIPWSRKWHVTPILLPGKSHGQRSLASYSPWGHIELDMTEHTMELKYYITKYLIFKKKKKTQQRNQKAQDKQKTKGKVADVILIISKIIPLNVNGLNNLSKRQRLSYWIKKKQKTNICCCLLEIHSRFKTTNKLNVK